MIAQCRIGGRSMRREVPHLNSLSFGIEPSGDLSIVTSEDVDPGHQLHCRYVVSIDEAAAVRIVETDVGDASVARERLSQGAISDIPVSVVEAAGAWLTEAIERAPVGSALRTALETHLEHLRDAAKAGVPT